MKKSHQVLAIATAIAILFPGMLNAGKGGGRAVHVRGYLKQNGTYVAPHYRSAPDSTKANNWSTRGNFNPYTSNPGTKANSSIQGGLDGKWSTEGKARTFKVDGAYDEGKALRSLDHPPRAANRSLFVGARGQTINQFVVPRIKTGEGSAVRRDEKGRIVRSASARREFMVRTGYPNGRPGYVIDHIVSLKRGGCDCPENMQWQTVEEAKAKDKWE